MLYGTKLTSEEKMKLRVKHDNNRLNRLDNTDCAEVAQLSNRIVWYNRFNKIPKVVSDALIDKFTKILDGTWYGDEESERIIKEYVR